MPGQGEATNTDSTNRVNTISLSVNVVSSSFTTVDPGRERAQRNEFESVFRQDKDTNGNSTCRMFTPVNVVGSSYENLGGSIPVTGIFSGAYNDKDVDAEANLNNLETTMSVSPIPTTRIHKDHPKEHIIGDINSATQTRRMIKMSKEHAMVWTLVDLPKGKRAIGTKWVYRNKKDERGIEMDVKCAFLYGTIEEEVYVCQLPRFEDPQFPDKVYKVEKALYGQHQAPRACKGDILLVQVYVDDIIFGSTKKSLYIEFKVMQRDDGIFISQDKYVADILKKFNFSLVKTVGTPIETNKALLKDEKVEDVDVHLYRSMIRSLMYLTASRSNIMFVVCACARDSPFDLEAFSDSDYAGASLDRKSTTGAEYVAAAICYGQVLWIQNQMLDYGFNFMNTKIYIDNESTICIVKNPVFHSKTKHIEIRNHFIRDSYEKKLIQHTITQYSLILFRFQTAATTASSLEAEQDSGNINRTQSMATLNESFPHGIGSDSGPRHSLTDVRHKLMLLVITSYYWFWATAKAKTVNGECQIQALVDKKKVIITKKSVRSDLMLEDAEGTESLFCSSHGKFLIHTILQCLSAKTTAWNKFSSTMSSAIICLATNQKFNFSKYIFDNMMKNLEGGVKFIMYPRFVQVFLDKQVDVMSKLKGIYVTPSHAKKIFANIKREGKCFFGIITPLFQTMMVQASKDIGKDSAAPIDSHSTPIVTQLSSKPQKKKSRRKQRKDNDPTKPIPDKATNEEHVSTPSYDPPQSGEDRLQLTELMSLCTSLQEKVLDLEKAKTAQAKEIASLKKRVKQLEKRKKSRTSGLKRLRKGRKIADLDADAEVTLMDETQERNDEDLMFDTDVLNVSAADPVTTAGEVVTTASATTTVDELTLAQTLIEIKAAKPKAVTTAATTITTAVSSTRPKVKGIVFHDQEEQAPAFTPIVSFSQASQLPQAKDKGKAKMVEPKKPLKKKDQIALDEELALRLHAEEEAELEKERVAQEEASKAT
ncbi:putative ribonuclease H-like domain-containing protein [Tanacetum coccineum]